MKIDLHVHPSTSAGATTRPEELIAHIRRHNFVERAREKGLDGICFTEHDRAFSPAALRLAREEFGFAFFGGMEVSTNYADFGHVLVFGLDSYVSGIWDINKLSRTAHEAGGVLIVAHPFREALYPRYPSGTVLSVEEAMEWPVFRLVDGIEVYNGATYDRENAFAANVCQRLGLNGTGGSDAHSSGELGTGVTIFEREIHDEQELIAELKAGRFRPAVRDQQAGFREWPFVETLPKVK